MQIKTGLDAWMKKRSEVSSPSTANKVPDTTLTYTFAAIASKLLDC